MKNSWWSIAKKPFHRKPAEWFGANFATKVTQPLIKQ